MINDVSINQKYIINQNVYSDQMNKDANSCSVTTYINSINSFINILL